MSTPTPAPPTPQKLPSVMLLVPSGDMMHSQTTYGLTMAMANMVAQGIQVAATFETASTIAYARRKLTEHFMKSTCDFAWWVDSDMAFPMDAPIRLLNRGVPLVGCNYRRRYFPTPNFTAMNGEPGKTVEYATTDASPDMERVDCIPHGMMMVHRSVYMRVPGPHYVFDYNPQTNIEVGEDYYFCAKVRAAGIDVWCDNALSKAIAHVGVFNYNYNLSQAVDAVKANIVKI